MNKQKRVYCSKYLMSNYIITYPILILKISNMIYEIQVYEVRGNC